MSNAGKPLVSKKDLLALAAVTAAYAGLLLLFPDAAPRAIESSRRFFVEMIGVLPAVVILMGLFSVFVSKEFVARYLGTKSGLKGFFVSVFMGTLPAGPLYVAFPLVRAMLAKGASVTNMIAFLTAYACIKLPQELMEVQFLGPAFTASRFFLTMAAAGIMGVLASRIMAWGDGIRAGESTE